jgi:hypothetical protein
VFEYQRLTETPRILGSRGECLKYSARDRDRQPIKLAAGWRHHNKPPSLVAHLPAGRRRAWAARSSSSSTPLSPAAIAFSLSRI